MERLLLINTDILMANKPYGAVQSKLFYELVYDITNIRMEDAEAKEVIISKYEMKNKINSKKYSERELRERVYGNKKLRQPIKLLDNEYNVKEEVIVFEDIIEIEDKVKFIFTDRFIQLLYF